MAKNNVANEIWQEKAKIVIERTGQRLWEEVGGEVRNWLKTRGINEETARKAELGFIPKDVYLERKNWGLSPETSDKTGKPKKVWLPEGLLIPCRRDGSIIRLRIRRFEPDIEPKYILVPGSDTRPMLLKANEDVSDWIIIESELDALLIQEKAGDIVNIAALGSAQIKPDDELKEVFCGATTILVSLDSDEAGAKASWETWLSSFPNAKRWPVPEGKDPGEFYKAGGDIRLWFEAGLLEGPDVCYYRGNPGVIDINKVIQALKAIFDRKAINLQG